ncbi:hypothetical protein FBALC1_14627 [Flavobacteriales bacterium ALC-1]|nr:hypothetical protein FBALC1_14627 [Flavobacteriales bacterium ALC-1]
MKDLIQITTVLFLLVQSIGFSQEKNTEVISEKQITETQVDTTNLKSFVGKYLLVEADFELEIVKEDDKMYIISPFSKDILIQKNETTLHEPSRGVDLELIKDNKDALKFTQNGYETIIERVNSKTKS